MTRWRQAGIVPTRLVPPRLPPHCLPRSSLVERVVAGLRGPLVVISAPSGAGKSTLLAQATGQLGEPVVWLTLDERLPRAAGVAAHLAAGFEALVPGFGAGLSWNGSAADIAEALTVEVATTVPQDVFIVLDDVHAIRGQSAADLLASLVAMRPQNVHYAMAGRGLPAISLARLRTQGLIEVGPSDLALARDEVAELITRLAGAMDASRIADISQTTEGWISGVVLAARHGVPTRGAEGRSEVFQLLAEEVLAHEPRHVRQFLVTTAICERVSPAIASALTGRDDAADILRGLADRQVLVARLDSAGEWYRYHNLLRSFLRGKLAERPSELLRRLHGLAADALVKEGEPLEAVAHLLHAGQEDRAVTLLEPLADQVLTREAPPSLVDALDRIPVRLREASPSLTVAHAALLVSLGRHEDSFAALETAIGRLLEMGEGERAGVALLRLLQAMVAAGTSPRKRIEVAARHLARLPPNAAVIPAIRLQYAAALAYGCHWDDADAQLRAATAARSRSDIISIHARIVRAFYIGLQRDDPEIALLEVEEALATLERAPDTDALGLIVYAHLSRAYMLIDLGRHEEALRALEQVALTSGSRGLGPAVRRSVGYFRARALAGLGRWDEVHQIVRPSERAGAAGDRSSYGYRLRVPAAMLAAHRGEAGEVLGHIRAIRRELDAYGQVSDAPMLLADLAGAAAAAGLEEPARELAEDAYGIAVRLGSVFPRARAALSVALLRADAVGDERLAEALQMTARWSLQALWTRKERRSSATLLARALRRRIGPPELAGALAAQCGSEVFLACAEAIVDAPVEVRERLAVHAGRAGVDAEGVEALLRDRDPKVRQATRRASGSGPRPPLRFLSLGAFRVLRATSDIPNGSFGRERARALLAALLCAGRPVHREELLEWFWPGLPPDRGLRAFHVTLYALRRTLEPALARGATESVIAAKGETYQVHLRDGDSWDVADLLSSLASANRESRAALEHLLAAEALLTGPLYPEWPYATWAETRRDEVRRAERDVLEGLGRELIGQGRPLAAIPRLERLIALNPEQEGPHRLLMEAYHRAGESALAMRQYHAFRAILRRELSIEPSVGMRALYSDILREAPVAR